MSLMRLFPIYRVPWCCWHPRKIKNTFYYLRVSHLALMFGAHAYMLSTFMSTNWPYCCYFYMVLTRSNISKTEQIFGFRCL